MRITALERPPRKRRLDLHLDGIPVLTLSPEVCVRFALRIGLELTPDQLDELRGADARHSALAAALRILSYHPHSEGEMRHRLARRGFDGPTVDATIARLRQLRLLDDAAFSRSWVETRDRTSPRSRHLLASELLARRVDRPTADAAAVSIDDSDAAYRACARRAPLLATLSWQDFRRRLGDFLLRRGFDHETVRATVARAWDELGGQRDDADAGH